MLYWDTCFIGVTAIDLEYGLTSINLNIAALEKKMMERSRRVVALCDSSKFGRHAYAMSGPVGVIDVLITDIGLNSEVAEDYRAQGIEIVLAGPGGNH